VRKNPRRKFSGSVELNLWTDLYVTTHDIEQVLSRMVAGIEPEETFDHFEVEIVFAELGEVDNDEDI
jgi:hypothetical protein